MVALGSMRNSTYIHREEATSDAGLVLPNLFDELDVVEDASGRQELWIAIVLVFEVDIHDRVVNEVGTDVWVVLHDMDSEFLEVSPITDTRQVEQMGGVHGASARHQESKMGI